MKKLTSLLLLASLAAGTLASCGGADASVPSDGSDSVAQTSATYAETTDPYVADELPADLNFNNKTVRWLIGDYFNAYWGDFYAETETGSTINDSVYAARRSVEERLNIKLEMTQFTYSSSETAKYTAQVTGLVLSGDTIYHAVAGSPQYSLITQGDYFLKLNENKYIDLEKPWWNQSVANLMPSGVVYFLPGDGSLSLIKHTFCVYVNLDNLKNSGYNDDIYEFVLDGGWTIDSLREIIKGSYRDLNGDQKADPFDFYGLTFGDNNKYIGFPKSCGVNIFIKNKDNTYTMASGSDTAVKMIEKCCELVHGDENVLGGTANTDKDAVDTGYSVFSGGGNYASKAFMEGRSIFAAQIVGDAPTLFKDTTFKYGMLPYPKLDDKQSDYITSPQRYAAFFMLATCPDTELAGATLEAWSSVCYRTLQPEYFETTLKVRYAHDHNMSMIFDILRNKLTFELGDIFASYFKMTPAYEFKQAIIKNNPNWASTYASYEANDKAALEKLMEAFQK